MTADPSATRLRPGSLIEAEIDVLQPRVELRMGADKNGLPLMRQALRALGQATGADPDALHDAELALTEACSNAVLHAYRGGVGTISVVIEVTSTELLATVRDHGRGMPERRPTPHPGRSGGLGLSLIEALARDVEIRTQQGIGTEVVMALPARSHGRAIEIDPISDSLVERVVRRLLAIAAAQVDLTPERIMEGLLAAELLARHAPRHLLGDALHLRIAHQGMLELSIGPLQAGGAAAVVQATDVPLLGPVVRRLADDVRTGPVENGRPAAGEELALLFAT